MTAKPQPGALAPRNANWFQASRPLIGRLGLAVLTGALIGCPGALAAVSTGSIALVLLAAISGCTLFVGGLIWLAVDLNVYRAGRRQQAATAEEEARHRRAEEQLSKLRAEIETAQEVEVYLGADRLEAKFQEMRARAQEVRAIWSMQYPEDLLEKYFEEEGRALDENKNLHITRLVNSDAIPSKFEQVFRWFVEKHSERLRVYETDLRELECYIASNPRRMEQPVAMLVINDAKSASPAIGFYMDGARSARLSGAVGSLIEWFDRLAKPAKAPRFLEGPDQNVWDKGAPVYDKLVTQTDHAFLRPFLDEEQTLFADFLRTITGQNGKDKLVSVVEVGCGTGRSLIQLRTGEQASRFAFLIGTDTSTGMLLQAEQNWERVRFFVPSEAADQPILFVHMDGRSIHRILDDVWPSLANEMTLSGNALLDHTSFMQSRKVYSCLLNTLGVMHDPERAAVLQAMVKALNAGDSLVISVFDADVFPKVARDLYSYLSKLTGPFKPERDFDDAAGEFQSPEYYSHWFRSGDIPALLEKMGLNRERTKEVRFEPGGRFITYTH